jgi:hypothetical protein
VKAEVGARRIALALNHASEQRLPQDGTPEGSRSCALPHARKGTLTCCEDFREHFRDFRRLHGRSEKMYRRHREELERKLAQAHRLALEPTDPLTRERLAQLVEDLEFQLQSLRKAA